MKLCIKDYKIKVLWKKRTNQWRSILSKRTNEAINASQNFNDHNGESQTTPCCKQHLVEETGSAYWEAMVPQNQYNH